MGSGASSSRHPRRVQSSNPGTAQGLNQVPMNTSSLGNPERGERENVLTSFSLAIYDRTNYHIWSLFSMQRDGLMQLNLDPSLKDNFVSCNGAFSDTTGKTIITTRDINTNGTLSGKLFFKHLESSKQYVIVAEEDGNGTFKIIAMETDDSSHPDKATFVFHSYGFNSYTMFKNKFYKKYLVCDRTGNTTLVDIPYPDNPNPQALFILNMLSED